MKRLFFLFTSLVFLFSSCVKDPDPDTRFSILGDSFSSLEGYVDPETNDPWPNYYQIGVTGPELMWWSQVAAETGWIMERNNSFSGTAISNYDPNNYYGAHSYLRRMNDLGNPDVLFVFGGTNDIYYRVPLGDYCYEGWTEEQLCTFRPAMSFMLEYLKRRYSKAEIYFLVDMELCIDDTDIDDAVRQDYIESMHRIANHYQVECIDLYGIEKSWWHPNPTGQRSIARQVIEALDGRPNV